MKYLILSVVAAIGVAAVLLATQKDKGRPTVSRSSHRADNLWLTDYKKAEEQAKASNKPLLLEFTGSDWCPPCRQLQKQILATPEFQQYASNHFVLVELDFPRARVQSPEIVQQNQILAQRFQIEVFPTLIMLNNKGKKIGELIGFDPNAGPEGFIAALEKFRKS